MRHFLNRFGQVGKKFPLLIASLIMVITSGIYLLRTQNHQAEANFVEAVATESATVNPSTPVTKIGFLKKIVNLEPVNKTDEVISNPSATPTPSPTSSSTSTPNPTPTPTPTITPTPTSTPTPTPTLTPTPTPTPSPSPTLAPAETSAYNFNFGSNHSAVANATGTITLSMIRNQNGYWDLQISGSFTGLVADRTYQVWICGINCSSHNSAKFTADSQGSASYSTTINHAQANDPANRIVLWEVPPTGEVIENSTTCYQLSNNSTPCLSAPIAW